MVVVRRKVLCTSHLRIRLVERIVRISLLLGRTESSKITAIALDWVLATSLLNAVLTLRALTEVLLLLVMT